MNSRHLIGLFKELGAVLKDTWSAVEDSGFCCGIGLNSQCSTEMPTSSSCCGVRL
jgi:hypothetical protein